MSTTRSDLVTLAYNTHRPVLSFNPMIPVSMTLGSVPQGWARRLWVKVELPGILTVTMKTDWAFEYQSADIQTFMAALTWPDALMDTYFDQFLEYGIAIRAYSPDRRSTLTFNTGEVALRLRVVAASDAPISQLKVTYGQSRDASRMFAPWPEEMALESHPIQWDWVEGFPYQLTTTSGVGNWISALAELDRPLVLSLASSLVTAPVQPPTLTVDPAPQTAVPITDAETRALISSLMDSMLLLSTKLDVLASQLPTNVAVAAINTNLAKVNANVVRAGENSMAIADATIASIDSISTSQPTLPTRVAESAATFAILSLLTGR